MPWPRFPGPAGFAQIWLSDCTTVVQRLYNGCTTVVQRLCNGCTTWYSCVQRCTNLCNRMQPCASTYCTTARNSAQRCLMLRNCVQQRCTAMYHQVFDPTSKVCSKSRILGLLKDFLSESLLWPMKTKKTCLNARKHQWIHRCKEFIFSIRFLEVPKITTKQLLRSKNTTWFREDCENISLWPTIMLTWRRRRSAFWSDCVMS